MLPAIAVARASPRSTSRKMCTNATHASFEMTWAWVTADAPLISSSLAVVSASGAMRMREPLPFERSPSQPRPRSIAVAVAFPTSKAEPSIVYAPS